MKAENPVETKVYIDVYGRTHDKKSSAADTNIAIARREAMRELLAKYYSFCEITKLSLDDFVEFIAENGDEVIEALTDQS